MLEARTTQTWAGRGDNAATPGNTFPSSSSRLAPPPVETWLTLSSVLYLAAHVAVSPPPMIVQPPFSVNATTASMIDFVPLAKLSNSKTPAGPFQTTTFALATTSLKSSLDFGPQSKPIQPSGIPDSTVASPTSASSANLLAVTKSTGK